MRLLNQGAISIGREDKARGEKARAKPLPSGRPELLPGYTPYLSYKNPLLHKYAYNKSGRRGLRADQATCGMNRNTFHQKAPEISHLSPLEHASNPILSGESRNLALRLSGASCHEWQPADSALPAKAHGDRHASGNHALASWHSSGPDILPPASRTGHERGAGGHADTGQRQPGPQASMATAPPVPPMAGTQPSFNPADACFEACTPALPISLPNAAGPQSDGISAPVQAAAPAPASNPAVPEPGRIIPPAAGGKAAARGQTPAQIPSPPAPSQPVSVPSVEKPSFSGAWGGRLHSSRLRSPAADSGPASAIPDPASAPVSGAIAPNPHHPSAPAGHMGQEATPAPSGRQSAPALGSWTRKAAQLKVAQAGNQPPE